jgi:hypothetical protein
LVGGTSMVRSESQWCGRKVSCLDREAGSDGVVMISAARSWMCWSVTSQSAEPTRGVLLTRTDITGLARKSCWLTLNRTLLFTLPFFTFYPKIIIVMICTGTNANGTLLLTMYDNADLNRLNYRYPCNKCTTNPILTRIPVLTSLAY